MHTLSDALRTARARWLGGDPEAWSCYVECCLRLEAEIATAKRTSERTSPCPAEPGRLASDRAPQR